MKKQAGWKEQLAKALQDKRLLGAAIAGTAGGIAGGFGIPGLIWKKPTKKQRAITGGTTAAIAALAAAAAMGEGQKEEPFEKATSNIGKAFSNLGSIISGDRPTLAELRQMGPVARTLKGYGKNVPAWLVRRFRGIFPDWEGLGGKSQKAKQREAVGELPKTDDNPSTTLAGLKLLTNTGIGIGTGWKHYANLVNRYKEKTLANELAKIYKSKPSAFQAALSKDPGILDVLNRWSNNSGSLLIPGQGLKANTGNILGRLKQALQHKGQTWASNNTFGLANPWLKNIQYNKELSASALRDRITDKLSGTALKDFNKALGGVNTKPSFLRRMGYGARGVGRGFLMAALAGAAQELLGANQTQNLDTARDLYADLKK